MLHVNETKIITEKALNQNLLGLGCINESE